MAQDNSHIRLGQRVKKHKLTPHKWEITEQISPDRACLVILTGSATETDKKANNYAKETLELLKNKSLPVYAVAYNKGERDFRQDREAVLARYGQANPRLPYIRNVKEEDKYYVPRYICELYTATLALRLRQEDGNKAPLALAAQRLNMIPFITHCQGSTALQQMEYLMEKDMAELGYTKTQRQYLFRQIHSINVAPVTPIGKTQTTAFKFITLKDEVALSVHTAQTNYIYNRQLDDIKPIMDISLFRPTENETIFAASSIYYENNDANILISTPTTEHSYAALTDIEDNDRTIAGDKLSYTFRTILNWLAEYALKNQTEFSELPSIFKEKRFNFILKETQNNRYEFIKREISHARQNTPSTPIIDKKQR